MPTPNAQSLPDDRPKALLSAGLVPPPPTETQGARTVVSRWYAFGLTVATIVWAIIWHGDAFAKMASLWWRSETFAHGLVIYPISIWLIYRMRVELGQVPIRPCAWALLPIGLAGFVFLLGTLGGVDAAREFGIVAMIPLIVWCIMGTKLARTIMFPLAFTLLAVPVGEFMLPVLMEHTADFTVAALRLSGVPVYREGLYFTVPSGHWSVVEACSGLRYLIASVTLGCLFAYLSYRTLWRRVLFVIASIAVPIVANWLRAYMIVMIGHLSGMKLAVGVDHLLYGWIFFGLVMLLLFWVGSFWREDTTPGAQPASNPRQVAGLQASHGYAFVLASIGVALLAALAPGYASYLAANSTFDPSRQLVFSAPPSWSEVHDDRLSEFVPRFLNARATLHKTYTAGEPVGVFVAYYADQSEGRELISFGNEIVNTSDKRWQKVGEEPRSVLDGRYRLLETTVRSGHDQLLVWHLYWIGGHWTIRKEEVKIRQALERLLGQGDGSAVLAVYTRADGGARARERLEAFLAAGLSETDRQLRQLAAPGGRR